MRPETEPHDTDPGVTPEQSSDANATFAPEPVGVAPIEPDTPFNEDLYDAMSDAFDALIAQADEPHSSSKEGDGDES